jgi:hypothetical protein
MKSYIVDETKLSKVKIRKHDSLWKSEQEIENHREYIVTTLQYPKESFVVWTICKEFGSLEKYIEHCLSQIVLHGKKIELMKAGVKYISPKKKEKKNERS